MARTATLAGTELNPEIWLRFSPSSAIPAGVKLPHYPRQPSYGKALKVGKPQTLLDWVKLLPCRHFDPERKVWVVTDLGADGYRVLGQLGFDCDFNLATWDSLTTPLVGLDPDDRWNTLVYPRFSSVELPAGSWFDKERGAWVCYTPDLSETQWAPDDVRATAYWLRAEKHAFLAPLDTRAKWPARLARLPRAPIGTPPPPMPPIPNWFGEERNEQA